MKKIIEATFHDIVLLPSIKVKEYVSHFFKESFLHFLGKVIID